MRVLIIDDNEISVKGIINHVKDKQWEYKLVDFENATSEINTYNPDVVILDLKDDAENNAAENGAAGDPIFHEITDNRFRPIIIFSAIAETFSLNIENPLVIPIPKGDEEPVIELLEKWQPYVDSIKTMRDEMNSALKASTEIIGEFLKMPTKPEDVVIKYMLNKRATQHFDQAIAGENPPAWIQYEFPPMLPHLVVADILRVKSETFDSSKPGKPEEYAVILTPSCDLARIRSSQSILIARAEDKSKFDSNCILKKSEALDSKEGISKVERMMKSLTVGYNSAKVAIPELPNKIPHMTVDLKNINLVSPSEIALNENAIDENTKFIRIASVSSPFREQLVWAHMINSCRPGMPERDYEQWAQMILQ